MSAAHLWECRQVAPLALPSLTRAEAAAARRRHTPRAALAVGSGTLRLNLEGFSSALRCPAPVHVGLDWGGAAISLWAPQDLIQELLRSLDRSLEPVLPPDLTALLIELSLAHPIEAWQAASGRELSIIDVTAIDVTGGRPYPSGDALALLVTDGSRQWSLSLEAAPSTLDMLLAAWPAAADDADIPLGAVLRRGATRLSVGLVASLRPGDIVLPETRVPGDGAMLVVGERWTATARRGSDGWQVAATPVPAGGSDAGGWVMSSSSETQEDAGSTDDIPVVLTFEIGRLTISVGELRRLGPGAVLELGRAPDELVEIAANGRAIGRGELVDVDGQVGVRLLRLLGRG